MKDELMSYLDTFSQPHKSLLSFLELNNWHVQEYNDDAVLITNPEFRIKTLLNTNSEYGDYKESLLNFVEKIAPGYKKDIDILLLDIFDQAETFNFRFDTPNKFGNNLPLSEVQEFLMSLENAITESARAVDKLSVQRKNRLQNLSESCLFGQTKVGSFIITLSIKKVNIKIKDLPKKDLEQLGPIYLKYQHVVSQNLYRKYQELLLLPKKRNVERRDEVKDFVKQNLGISRSIAAAVNTESSGLEIDPIWSDWFEIENDFKKPIEFKTNDFDWLPAKIKSIQKEISMDDAVEIYGLVKETKRDLDLNFETRNPSIQILYSTGKSMQTARVELTPEQYERARHAASLKNDKWIYLVAKIIKRPRINLILNENIIEFDIVSR